MQPDERFLDAVALCRDEFVLRASRYVNSWLPARSIVAAALNGGGDGDPRIAELATFCPWKDHLATLEEELGIGPRTRFVLYADTAGSWRVQAVPAEEGSFESRLMLPEPWRGFRDAELDAVAGIDGCVFVHASGFIGGNKTRDGARAMATKALAIEDGKTAKQPRE